MLANPIRLIGGSGIIGRWTARPVSAVAAFLKEDMLAGLRFGQARGVPHISISSDIHEIGPAAAAIVLGAEWLMGATTVPTLQFAKQFGKIRAITIGAPVLHVQNIS